MIIDHDETQRTGQVMTLSQRGTGGVAETMPLRVADVEEAVKTGYRPDIARSEVLEYRPPRESVTGRFVPAGPCAGLTLYGKREEGVERSGEDTATHALPAVEKITGKPSEAANLHLMAKQVQNSMRRLGVSVWYGEHTKEFWVMDSWGLHSFESVTTMYQDMGWS